MNTVIVEKPCLDDYTIALLQLHYVLGNKSTFFFQREKKTKKTLEPLTLGQTHHGTRRSSFLTCLPLITCTLNILASHHPRRRNGYTCRIRPSPRCTCEGISWFLSPRGRAWLYRDGGKKGRTAVVHDSCLAFIRVCPPPPAGILTRYYHTQTSPREHLWLDCLSRGAHLSPRRLTAVIIKDNSPSIVLIEFCKAVRMQPQIRVKCEADGETLRHSL